MRLSFDFRFLIVPLLAAAVLGNYADYGDRGDWSIRDDILLINDENETVWFNLDAVYHDDVNDANTVSIRASEALGVTYYMRWPVDWGDPNAVLCTNGVQNAQLRWSPFDANSIVWDGNDFGLPDKTPWSVMFVDANGYPLYEDNDDFSFYWPEHAFGIGLGSIAAGTRANNLIQVYGLLDFEPNLFNVSLGVGTQGAVTGPNNLRVGYGAGAALTGGLENTLGGKDAGYYLADSNDNTGWGFKVIGGGGDGTANGEYTEYFVGYYRGAGYGNIVVKAKSDSTIDTTWGTNGYWGFSGAYGGTTDCYVLHQLDDGRLLVGHNNFWHEAASWSAGGKLISATMLTVDGAIDTSWGHDGFFHIDQGTDWQYPYLNVVSILEDLDGNFYFIGTCNDGSTYSCHKTDSNGTRITQRSWATAPKTLRNPAGALWHDEARTQILVYGAAGNYPSVGYMTNCCLISTADFSPVQDGSWGGLGYGDTDGYARVDNQYDPVYNMAEVTNIIKLSDGNYLAKHNYHSDPNVRTLSKFAYDGKSYITAWGTNGHSAAGSSGYSNSLCEVGTNVYSVSNYIVPGETDWYDDLLRSWDSNGNITNSVRLSSSPNAIAVYHYLGAINDQLIFGTRKVSPAQYRVEMWDTDFTFVSGFDIPGLTTSHYIRAMIPDETTREPGSSDVHRVAAFGANAAGRVVEGADDGLYLGTYSGAHNETDPNQFFLDNLDRGSLTDEQTKGMMYGYFAEDPNDQTLTVNAHLGVPSYGSLKVGDWRLKEVSGNMELQFWTGSAWEWQSRVYGGTE